MKLLNSLFLAVVLYLTVQLLECPVSAHATSLAKALQERSSSAPGRQLQASTKISSLAKRHNNFITTSEVELTYAEGENLGNEPNYVAGVYVESLVPVLLLEDFEHLAEYIVCQPGYIILQVLPDVNHVATEAALLSLAGGGLVITSHYGCNVRGERKLLRIGIVDMNEDGSVFVLHTEHTTWKGSFSSVHIQMRHTNESYAFRPHKDLRRRQGASAASTPVDLPTLTVPVPTATSTASTNQLNLDHALINQALLPADSSIQVTCKNCSTFGTIDFSFASFELNPNLKGIIQDEINFGDIFTGGEATVVANGLGAHVELLTNISRSDNFQLPLFQIPLLFAIAIPGIGSAGLLYAPTINIGYNLNGSIAFTYGFELMVPDGSRIFLDLTDPTNSSISGFSDSKLNTLPFQASVDVGTVLLDVSLRHQVQIGFQFNEPGVGADVGIYLDLPKFEANISHVSNVDENCTALSTSQSQDKAIAQKVLTDVYLIEPLVDWQIGVDGEARIGGPEGSFDVSLGNGTIANILSSCLNFDKKSGTYIPAVEVVKHAEKNAAARQLQIPHIAYRTAFISGLVALLISDLFGLG